MNVPFGARRVKKPEKQYRPKKKTVTYHTLVQRKGKHLKFNSITCRGVKKHHDYVISLLLAGDRRDR